MLLPVGPERTAPLSWAQAYMWRAVSLPGNGSAMDFRIIARPRAGTSVEAAIACLAALAERHPALRTCVETVRTGS